jgi:hypothetical protein
MWIDYRRAMSDPPLIIQETTLRRWEVANPHLGGRPLTTTDLPHRVGGRGINRLYLKAEIDASKDSILSGADYRCNKRREKRIGIPLADGISIAEVKRLHPDFPHPRLSIPQWCCSPDPLLGRKFGFEFRKRSFGMNLHDIALYVSKADVQEHMEIVENRLNRVLPGNKGIWIAEGIYQDAEGLWYTAEYLERTYGLTRGNFSHWTQVLMIGLDPNVNEGKLRKQEVLRVCAHKKRGLMTDVFHDGDLRAILARRGVNVLPSDEQCSAGEWLVAGRVYHDAQGQWFSFKCAQDTCNVSRNFIVTKIGKVHPALDPSINHGQPRVIERDKDYAKNGGPAKIQLIHSDDLRKIVAWTNEKRPALKVKPDRKWETPRKMGAKLGLDYASRGYGRTAIQMVLRWAREVHGVETLPVEESKGKRHWPVRSYDSDAFGRLLKGRSIQDCIALARKWVKGLRDAKLGTGDGSGSTSSLREEIRAKRPKRGRKPGQTKDVKNRIRDMLAAWDRGDFNGNKAAAGRAFGFDRSDATKHINKHIAECRK